jgi:hypothetical protein
LQTKFFNSLRQSNTEFVRGCFPIRDQQVLVVAWVDVESVVEKMSGATVVGDAVVGGIYTAGEAEGVNADIGSGSGNLDCYLMQCGEGKCLPRLDMKKFINSYDCVLASLLQNGAWVRVIVDFSQRIHFEFTHQIGRVLQCRILFHQNCIRCVRYHTTGRQRNTFVSPEPLVTDDDGRDCERGR